MALENLLSEQPPTKVIDCKGKLCAIDLSAENIALKGLVTANDYAKYINSILQESNCEAAFGGYNEKRSLYKQSTLFNEEEKEERNVHLGLDIWMNAGTPVFAAFHGIIHSFNFNAGAGNYGPTIILEHRLENELFYTLYGHMSMESIEEIEIGETVTKGAKIGTLGDTSVNGNYAPHLHFQIIKDIASYFGDYPGVCTESSKASYLKNCPDPNLLLKL